MRYLIRKIMTDKDMNSYRFGMGEEPTDEMLAQIMREVSEIATAKHQQAHNDFFALLHSTTQGVKMKWESRIAQSVYE